MRRFLLTGILVLSLFISADGFEIGSSRRAAAGGAVLLSAPVAGDIVDYPAVYLDRNSFAIESGFERRFELSDLDRIYLSAGYRLGDFSLAAGVSQRGKEDYYLERVNRGSVSYYAGLISMGASVSAKSIEIGEGYGNFGEVALGLGGGFKYDILHLAVSFDNINQPRLDKNAPRENVITSFLAEMTGGPRVSLLGKAVLEKSEKPRLAMAQYIRLMDAHALIWNITGNPLTYGGGVEIYYSGFAISYAASYHPALGFSHNAALRYSFSPAKKGTER